VNPEAYLRDTFAKIADRRPISRIHELMPWPRRMTPNCEGDAGRHPS
jgi:hypothetical protein